MKSGFLQAIAVITCAAALLLTGGCKKKDDSPTLPVTGSWMDISKPNMSYLVFKDDATLSVLSSNAIGAHTKTSDVYTADDNTITFSPTGGTPQLFNYKVSNDTLYFSNVYSNLVYVKATVQADSWIKKSALLQTIPLGSGMWFGAMDWNGLDFVVSNAQAQKVYKIDGTTFNVYDSITIAQTATGLAITGTDTWLCDPPVDRKLHRINVTTGATLFSSTSAPERPIMLATQGNDIWMIDDEGDMYTYNTLTDNFTLKHAGLGIQGGGTMFRPDMVIKDGYAYVCLFTSVIKLSLSTYMVEETYVLDATAGYAIGIAHNGSAFYTINLDVNSFATGTPVLSLNKIEL